MILSGGGGIGTGRALLQQQGSDEARMRKMRLVMAVMCVFHAPEAGAQDSQNPRTETGFLSGRADSAAAFAEESSLYAEQAAEKADEAHKFARRAYRSEKSEESKDYARKAMRAAEEARQTALLARESALQAYHASKSAVQAAEKNRSS